MTSCDVCPHDWRLHHDVDGCLVLRCDCWRTPPMNGPDHYREAERLLAEAEDRLPYGNLAGVTRPEQLLAEAQVHATLALTAATATHSVDDAIYRDWDEALGWDDPDA